MIDVDRVRKASIGKWRSILANLGIEVPEDPKKHGPCPACGGKDRFRFDDKDGAGTFFCNACNAGDGFHLVQRVLGISFIESCQRVSDVIGISDFVKPNQEKPVDFKKLLIDLWKSSNPITGSDQASTYLHARGISLTPENVRFCPECYESETKSRIPAMVALVSGSDGKGVTMHRTYLDGTKKASLESPKKLMPHRGNMKGAAIRLFKPADVLGVAEGIETACAATQMFDIPTWACVSSTILESFIPPQEIKKIVIFGDNDSNFTGAKSAYKLANELYTKHDKIVEVQIPVEPGWDWADALAHQVTRNAA